MSREDEIRENLGEGPYWQKGLVLAILELADAVRYRTASVPFAQPVGLEMPTWETTVSPDVTVPFCPYCASPLNTAGNCVNVECHEMNKGRTYGSTGDEPI